MVDTSDVASASSAFELRGTGIGAMAGQASVIRTPPSSFAAPSSFVSTALLPGLRAGSLLSSQATAAEPRHDDCLDAPRTIATRAGSATAQWRTAQAATANRLGVRRRSLPRSTWVT